MAWHGQAERGLDESASSPGDIDADASAGPETTEIARRPRLGKRGQQSQNAVVALFQHLGDRAVAPKLSSIWKRFGGCRPRTFGATEPAIRVLAESWACEASPRRAAGAATHARLQPAPAAAGFETSGVSVVVRGVLDSGLLSAVTVHDEEDDIAPRLLPPVAAGISAPG